MIKSLDEATHLADEFVFKLSEMSNDNFSIIKEKTVETDNGWVFFYNTQDFINTGDPIFALAGNGPVFVKKSGYVIAIPSSSHWEELIKSL